MTSVIFILFYNYLFFLGKTICNFLAKYNETISEISEDPQYSKFYPMVSLFTIGNLLVVLNFFIPLNRVQYPIFFLTLFLLVLNSKSLKFKINFEYLLKNIFFPGVLSISLYASRLHYDSGGYHLNNQLWIRESKLVIGLSNLIQNYGFSSINEYLSSVLWLQNNFVYIFFINLIFYVLYFTFLYDNLSQNSNLFLRNSSIILILYSFLDNFGIGGGGNGSIYFQTIGKPDMPMSVLFIISSLMIINSLKEKEYSSKSLYFYLYMVFFTIQIKLFGVYLFILLGSYLFFYLRENKQNLLNIISKNKPIVTISAIWLAKNILISGCLFYPVEITCIPALSWYEKGDASELQSNISIVFTREYFIKWFENPIVIQIYSNFLISLLLLTLISFVMFKKSKIENRNVNFIFIFYLSVITLSWILTSPKPRWGVPVFTLWIIFYTLFTKNTRFKFSSIYKSISLILIFSVLLTPRAYSYQYLLTNTDMFTENYKVEAPIVEYQDTSHDWGVTTKDGDQRCWIKIDCLWIDKDVYPERIFGYTVFYPDLTLVETLQN